MIDFHCVCCVVHPHFSTSAMGQPLLMESFFLFYMLGIVDALISGNLSGVLLCLLWT